MQPCVPSKWSYQDTLNWAQQNVIGKSRRMAFPNLPEPPKIISREAVVIREIGEQLKQIHHMLQPPEFNQLVECSVCLSKENIITELQNRIIAGRQGKCTLEHSLPSVGSNECECKNEIVSAKKMIAERERKIFDLETSLEQTKREAADDKEKLETVIAKGLEREAILQSRLDQANQDAADAEQKLEKTIAEGMQRETRMKSRLETAKAYKGPKPRERKLHVCDACGYVTNEAYTFQKHTSTFCKLAPKDKKYACTICNERFNYDNLRIHLNRYTKPENLKKCKNAHINKSAEYHATLKQQLIVNRNSFLIKDE